MTGKRRQDLQAHRFSWSACDGQWTLIGLGARAVSNIFIFLQNVGFDLPTFCTKSERSTTGPTRRNKKLLTREITRFDSVRLNLYIACIGSTRPTCTKLHADVHSDLRCLSARWSPTTRSSAGWWHSCASRQASTSSPGQPMAAVLACSCAGFQLRRRRGRWQLCWLAVAAAAAAAAAVLACRCNGSGGGSCVSLQSQRHTLTRETCRRS